MSTVLSVRGTHSILSKKRLLLLKNELQKPHASINLHGVGSMGPVLLFICKNGGGSVPERGGLCGGSALPVHGSHGRRLGGGADGSRR